MASSTDAVSERPGKHYALRWTSLSRTFYPIDLAIRKRTRVLRVCLGDPRKSRDHVDGHSSPVGHRLLLDSRCSGCLAQPMANSDCRWPPWRDSHGDLHDPRTDPKSRSSHRARLTDSRATGRSSGSMMRHSLHCARDMKAQRKLLRANRLQKPSINTTLDASFLTPFSFRSVRLWQVASQGFGRYWSSWVCRWATLIG